MRLRIALYHNLPSGGAKRVVHETVRRLSEVHQVDLFCLESADQSFCDLTPYVQRTTALPFHLGRCLPSPFGRLNSLVWLADLLRVERLGVSVARIIDRESYDVVLVHPCMVTQAPSVLAYLRTPSLYYCHEPLRWINDRPVMRPWLRRSLHRGVLDRLDLPRALHGQLLARMDRRNTRAARTVLVNSGFTRDSVRRIYGVEAAVNRPGVDAEVFVPLATSKQRMIISVGALKPEKGFDFVIESIGTIPAAERPSLTIVSNAETPGERSYLEMVACREGVQADFRIGVTNQELVSLYNAAVLMAYAPVREPLGLASLESQACQTPVVGVDEGGVLETVIHGQTGVLEKREPQAFGAAIDAMFKDREMAAMYGRQGRQQVVERWNWTASVAQQEEWLVRLASARNPKVSCHPET